MFPNTISKIRKNNMFLLNMESMQGPTNTCIQISIVIIYLR